MKQVLRLRFLNFVTLRSFAVIPRNLKVGEVHTVKSRPMVSKRLFSHSSALGKSAESMGIDVPHDEKSKVEEVVLTGRVDEYEVVGDDLECIESLTVQELRVKLRSVGLPAKGRKQDLVCAFRNFLNRKIEGSLVGEDQQFPKMEPVSTKNKLSEKKTKSSTVDGEIQDLDPVIGVPGKRQTKKRVKEVQAEDSSAEIHIPLDMTKQKLSIKASKVSGMKPTSTKRTKLSEVASEDVGASDVVDLYVNQDEPWTVLAHKKPQKGWVPYNPRTMRRPPLTDTKSMKIMSWNVNGLRALLKLEGFSALQLAEREDFDVLCLQETKLQEKDVERVKQSLLDGYDNSFWTCSVSKLGYSGTAIISRIEPLSVRYGLGISDHDSEGRLVTVEFDTCYVISGYVPNSGDGLKRLSYRITQWDPSLGNYIKELEKSKPVILTGDLNCAHEEIDIYNPAGNKRSAGFTDEERESFQRNFLSQGFVDTFRKQHPGVVVYTYWGYRHNGRKTNKGWRLDYFLVSESIADKVHDSYILPDVTGSDHSPIGLILKL